MSPWRAELALVVLVAVSVGTTAALVATKVLWSPAPLTAEERIFLEPGLVAPPIDTSLLRIQKDWREILRITPDGHVIWHGDQSQAARDFWKAVESEVLKGFAKTSPCPGAAGEVIRR